MRTKEAADIECKESDDTIKLSEVSALQGVQLIPGDLRQIQPLLSIFSRYAIDLHGTITTWISLLTEFASTNGTALIEKTEIPIADTPAHLYLLCLTLLEIETAEHGTELAPLLCRWIMLSYPEHTSITFSLPRPSQHHESKKQLNHKQSIEALAQQLRSHPTIVSITKRASKEGESPYSDLWSAIKSLNPGKAVWRSSKAYISDMCDLLETASCLREAGEEASYRVLHGIASALLIKTQLIYHPLHSPDETTLCSSLQASTSLEEKMVHTMKWLIATRFSQTELAIHGALHAALVGFLAVGLARLFFSTEEEGLTEDEYFYVACMGFWHDYARPKGQEGVDLEDIPSALSFANFMLSVLKVDFETAKPFIEALLNKEPSDRFWQLDQDKHSGFILKRTERKPSKKVQRLITSIHDGDCFAIVRCRAQFKAAYLSQQLQLQLTAEQMRSLIADVIMLHALFNSHPTSTNYSLKAMAAFNESDAWLDTFFTDIENRISRLYQFFQTGAIPSTEIPALTATQLTTPTSQITFRMIESLRDPALNGNSRLLSYSWLAPGTVFLEKAWRIGAATLVTSNAALKSQVDFDTGNSLQKLIASLLIVTNKTPSKERLPIRPSSSYDPPVIINLATPLPTKSILFHTEIVQPGAPPDFWIVDSSNGAPSAVSLSLAIKAQQRRKEEDKETLPILEVNQSTWQFKKIADPWALLLSTLKDYQDNDIDLLALLRWSRFRKKMRLDRSHFLELLNRESTLEESGDGEEKASETTAELTSLTHYERARKSRKLLANTYLRLYQLKNSTIAYDLTSTMLRELRTTLSATLLLYHIDLLLFLEQPITTLLLEGTFILLTNGISLSFPLQKRLLKQLQKDETASEEKSGDTAKKHKTIGKTIVAQLEQRIRDKEELPELSFKLYLTGSLFLGRPLDLTYAATVTQSSVLNSMKEDVIPAGMSGELLYRCLLQLVECPACQIKHLSRNGIAGTLEALTETLSEKKRSAIITLLFIRLSKPFLKRHEDPTNIIRPLNQLYLMWNQLAWVKLVYEDKQAFLDTLKPAEQFLDLPLEKITAQPRYPKHCRLRAYAFILSHLRNFFGMTGTTSLVSIVESRLGLLSLSKRGPSEESTAGVGAGSSESCVPRL